MINNKTETDENVIHFCFLFFISSSTLRHNWLVQCTYFFLLLFLEFYPIIVYSKSKYALESVSVRPSSRLHDNSWKPNPIVMKFCTQNYLINISVEFEDENNSSRICWVTVENVIIFYSFLWKYWPIPIFVKKFLSWSK